MSPGGAYLLDEPEVVANQHGAAVEVVDGVGECVDGLDVQVIGGFVQEEQVGVLHGQPGETHAALLAVGQVLNGAHLDTDRRSDTDRWSDTQPGGQTML